MTPLISGAIISIVAAFVLTLADAAIAHLPAGATARVFDRTAELPHYSEDLDAEGQVPAIADELRHILFHLIILSCRRRKTTGI